MMRLLADGLARLHVQGYTNGAERLHGFKAIRHHIAVEFHPVAIWIMEVDTAGHVVFDGGLNRSAKLAQFPIGILQRLEALELPSRMMQAELRGRGRISRGQLEQGKIVVLRAKAQEHRAPLAIFMGHL